MNLTIETNDYWIVNEDTFIFKPEYNHKINYELSRTMAKYKKIIFSDYDDYRICVKLNNERSTKYSNNFKGGVYYGIQSTLCGPCRRCC